MNTNELLSLIDDMYPSATSDTVKVKYLNMGQDILSGQFGPVVTDNSLFTRAFDDEYSFPAGIEDISQIETFEIETDIPVTDKLVSLTGMANGNYALSDQVDFPRRVSATHVTVGNTDVLGTIVVSGVSGGVLVSETLLLAADSTVYSIHYFSQVTSVVGSGWATEGTADKISVGVKATRYETTRYVIGYKDDKPMPGNCIYQSHSSSGVKSLIIHPAPSYSGIPIAIRYHAKLSPLSASDLTKSPEFDSIHHNLLVLYACYQICANGSSPDTIQANRFSAEFEEGISRINRDNFNKQIIAPRKRRDNKIWHR